MQQAVLSNEVHDINRNSLPVTYAALYYLKGSGTTDETVSEFNRDK